jgi:hypothetical protein
MSIEAHTAADARTVITWREAVERAHSVARVFEDGRPVFGVDSLGHVVLANRAAAAFSGGAVAFGKAVPPGGTVAALVARFASRAVTGETTFERTRAVMGLRATMLGLKLGKVEVAPFGPLTLVTFAEGVAPIPDEGGVMGDPLDAGLAIDPPTGADAVDIADDAAAAITGRWRGRGRDGGVSDRAGCFADRRAGRGGSDRGGPDRGGDGRSVLRCKLRGVFADFD